MWSTGTRELRSDGVRESFDKTECQRGVGEACSTVVNCLMIFATGSSCLFLDVEDESLEDVCFGGSKHVCMRIQFLRRGV